MEYYVKYGNRFQSLINYLEKNRLHSNVIEKIESVEEGIIIVRIKDKKNIWINYAERIIKGEIKKLAETYFNLHWLDIVVIKKKLYDE